MKTICIDIDGVVCSNTWGKYENAVPKIKSIKKINQLFDKGNRIILFTSRFMGLNDENIKKVYEQGYQLTKDQLEKWGVKYHVLKMGKPSYDMLIDDKHFGYNERWIDEL